MSLEFKVFTAGLNKLDSMLAVYSRYLWERKCELYVQTGSWVTRQAEQRYLLALGGKPSSPSGQSGGYFCSVHHTSYSRSKLRENFRKNLQIIECLKESLGNGKSEDR